MIILSFKLKLIPNKETQFFLCFFMKLIQSFMKLGIDLFLHMSCFCVDFFYFQINIAQILC